MRSTVGAAADTPGQHTPGGREPRASVLELLVVPLVGLLALLEQATRPEVAGGLRVVEALRQGVVLARPQVLRELVVVDAPALGLLATAGAHIHGVPTRRVGV